MELKHLQALLGIADTGSFSAAATSIGTVQSNVSAHVARLERELGYEPSHVLVGLDDVRDGHVRKVVFSLLARPRR